MANINRDYLVIADLKSGKITSPNMSFYNTDKNIANLFVKLQITMSTNPSIVGFVNKEEASNYNVKLTVVKPKTTMLVELTGVVQDESVMGNGAVYLFDMPQNFTDQVGKYICELEITCMVNGREEVVTCDPFEYSVKESVVTGLNIEIEPNPDVPVLRQLIDEVRYLQENGGSIVNLSGYQKMEDDSLDTNNKTVVGGINELNDSKVDKIEGKGLSTVDFTKEKDAKLSGIAEGANNYTHPINHEPSIITQDATHRFVTDVEKEIWNNKSEFSGSYNDLTEKPDIPSIDGLATEVYVDDKVASIVNSAPETLDTLNELATALGNDPNFATTVANQIGTKASNDYVNAELAKKVNSEGYVATENNYSTAEKTKLANVEDNANNYVHPENHEPSIIIQDNEHRFVTDAEKETWNNKLSEHQDISHLAIKSQVDESLSQINQSNIERDKKISSIENINAVQNAKLDTLFNSASGDMELESNVNNIKLDSSKKGTATVNYIKGNTLVNCAKENKELILNDEINVEGTTCTINDTVEGGLVDVDLEGLSLNNLYENKQKNFQETVIYSPLESLNLGLLTEGKEYTVIILSNVTNYKSFRICDGNTTYDLVPQTIGNIAKFTYKPPTTELQKSVIAYFYPNQNKFVEGDQNKLHVLLLEGDYTNKPIPAEAFTGIKSVGKGVNLTNLVTRYSYNSAQYVATSYVDNSKLKANDLCTVLVNNQSEEDMRVYLNEDLFNKKPSFIVPSQSSIKVLAIVKNDYVYSADAPQQSALLKNAVAHTSTINYKACLVIGDYENSKLEYFEGTIKGYAIEIKSNNKNLFDIEEVKQNLSSRTQFGFVEYDGRENCVTLKDNINAIPWLTSPFKPNTRYRLTYSVFYQNKRGMYLRFIYTDGSFSTLNVQTTNQWINVDFISEAGKTVKYIDNSWGYPTSETKSYLDLDSVMLSEGTDIVPYVKHQQHKKVILLDEPLRGIEGGVKDRIIKREGKLYVDRKFKEVEFKGLPSESWGLATTIEVEDTCYFTMQISDRKFMLELLCNKFANIDVYHNNVEGIRGYIGSNHIGIRILKSKLETADAEGFKKWLQANPVTVVYELVTPVYEEIKDLTNEFPTYSEVTHVSTNTVIPCNQKIQNTGIECMLKPSTLYSIHDIRTGSGTAKYNLGGTVNTSNKITTGATLTDNYLRLYGKGLISRDVEVFEGDTPQTPYFSGMLSAFEDKKITQEMVDSGLEKAENLGKYRVGVKITGKNKCDNTKNKLATIDLNTGAEIKQNDCVVSDFILVYRDYSSSKIDKENKFVSLTYRYYDVNKNYLGSVKPNFYPHYVRLRALRKSEGINISLEDIKFQLEEGTQATQYEDYKEYKTSILLNSPLLEGNDIVVNDGKLYNYHKYGKETFDGSKNILQVRTQTNTIGFEITDVDGLKPSGIIICDKFPLLYGTEDIEGARAVGNANKIIFHINKTKLLTQDVQGFKQWLSEIPTTVVYELAEPYFEPITPQLPRWVLDIFDNSTISIDTIIPVESKFTYTSYIPSITAMQETNKNQDDLINVSLCATDEMYMMLEPLLQSVPQTLQINERMVSKMVDLYVAMVIRGLKTIDEVPLRYREEVKKILEQLEK